MLVNVLYSLLVVFGVGLVIFVHELGHYLAARAVGVRVEAFSIGFGKKIWGYTKGPTEYKLCMIPLGGYVKMAGEDPTRPTTGDPEEFGSKKVWQRILVIIAGVIMNMIFALIAFPIVFSIGVKFEVPVVGAVTPGLPAWQAGLQPDDRIVALDGNKVISFEDVVTEVAVSNGPMVFTIDRAGTTFDVTVVPEEKGGGFPVIGIKPPQRSEFKIDPALFETEDKSGIELQRAQALKAAGLTSDDVLIGLNGIPARQIETGWMRELERHPTRPVVLTVRNGSGLRSVTLPPVLEDREDSESWRIGVYGHRGDRWIVDRVVPDSPAEKLLGLRPKDRILAVNGTPIGPRTLVSEFDQAVGHGVDPARVATAIPITYNAPPTVTFLVKRGDAEETLTAQMPDLKTRARLLDTFTLTGPEGSWIEVQEGGPAQGAGLRTGDQVTEIDGQAISNWDELRKAVAAADGKPVSVSVKRDGKPASFTVTPVRTPIQQNVVLKNVRGVEGLANWESETVRVPFPESIKVGFVYTGRKLKQVVKTLRSLVRGSVSAKHLGGPITIFRASYRYSKLGIMRGLLFLAVISINLAILNILPIPVLDGGWLVFLIIEKIKGSPVSERVMGICQWIGLALLLSLMLFVTWRDLARLFGLD